MKLFQYLSDYSGSETVQHRDYSTAHQHALPSVSRRSDRKCLLPKQQITRLVGAWPLSALKICPARATHSRNNGDDRPPAYPARPSQTERHHIHGQSGTNIQTHCTSDWRGGRGKRPAFKAPLDILPSLAADPTWLWASWSVPGKQPGDTGQGEMKAEGPSPETEASPISLLPTRNQRAAASSNLLLLLTVCQRH